MEREKVVFAKDREIVLSHLSRFCDEKYNKNRYLELVNEMIFAKGHKTQRNNVLCRYIVEIVLLLTLDLVQKRIRYFTRVRL